VTEDNANTRAALTELNSTFEQKEITTIPLRHEPGSLAKACSSVGQGWREHRVGPCLLGMQGNDIEVGFVTSDPVMARSALSSVASAVGATAGRLPATDGQPRASDRRSSQRPTGPEASSDRLGRPRAGP
jgi:hypothetical protein